jgi:hypothetical protein
MYTNIDTTHALQTSPLGVSPLCVGYQANAIIVGPKILTWQNDFKSGNIFWRQKSGTAMGTTPSVNYGKLY